MKRRVTTVHSCVKSLLNPLIELINTSVMIFYNWCAFLPVSSTFHNLLMFLLNLCPDLNLYLLCLLEPLLLTRWHFLFVHILIPACQLLYHVHARVYLPIYQSFNPRLHHLIHVGEVLGAIVGVFGVLLLWLWLGYGRIQVIATGFVEGRCDGGLGIRGGI